MAFNFNKAILGGRLTKDPEFRTTTTGVSVIDFSIAVSRRTKKDEEPKTDFIDCTAWRQTAEFIARFFKKGSSICIVGEIHNEHYEKDGKMVTRQKVIADEATFVDGKNEKPEAPQFEDITNEEALPF